VGTMPLGRVACVPNTQRTECKAGEHWRPDVPWKTEELENLVCLGLDTGAEVVQESADGSGEPARERGWPQSVRTMGTPGAARCRG